MKREILVAAASNFSEAFRALGPGFENATGIHAIFSFGSTAQLARQVEQGAPFDVFAAADTVHPERLRAQGLLQSPVVFARGVVAVWIPSVSTEASARITLRDLRDPRFRIIAIAKPELAPYGQAAVDALKAAGIWEQIQPKVVYAENISMAKQFGALGNADAVLTAYSLVRHEKGTVLRVAPQFHGSLNHALGVLASSPHIPEARAFMDYLLRGPGKKVLQEYGYQTPTP